MSAVSELKSFESACYCDLVHTTCTYCDAVAMDKMTTKRPYAQQNAQRRSIYTDDETWAKLKAMGKGNASAGIREAVKRTQEREDENVEGR